MMVSTHEESPGAPQLLTDRETHRHPCGGATAMTTTVRTITPEAARQRRAQLLASVGGDEDALRARAAVYALDARELAALEEIDALDYLLGDTAASS